MSWELVVVDNASPTGPFEIASSTVPDATHVQTGRNAGYAAAFNIGVAAIAGGVRGDGPQRRCPAWRRAASGSCCAPCASRGPGSRYPKLATPPEPGPFDAREPKVYRELLEAVVGSPRLGRFWDVGVMVGDASRYRAETTTDWAEGSTQLISRECLTTCGDWDESFFLFSEETSSPFAPVTTGVRDEFVPTAGRPTWKAGRPTTRPSGRCFAATRSCSSVGGTTLLSSVAFYACAACAREASRAIAGKRARPGRSAGTREPEPPAATRSAPSGSRARAPARSAKALSSDLRCAQCTPRESLRSPRPSHGWTPACLAGAR